MRSVAAVQLTLLSAKIGHLRTVVFLNNKHGHKKARIARAHHKSKRQPYWVTGAADAGAVAGAGAASGAGIVLAAGAEVSAGAEAGAAVSVAAGAAAEAASDAGEAPAADDEAAVP